MRSFYECYSRGPKLTSFNLRSTSQDVQIPSNGKQTSVNEQFLSYNKKIIWNVPVLALSSILLCILTHIIII